MNLGFVIDTKKSPRTSSIVQITSFWSFEFSEDILRNQKIIIGLDTFSNQHLIYLAPFGLYYIVFVERCKITVILCQI